MDITVRLGYINFGGTEIYPGISVQAQGSKLLVLGLNGSKATVLKEEAHTINGEAFSGSFKELRQKLDEIIHRINEPILYQLGDLIPSEQEVKEGIIQLLDKASTEVSISFKHSNQT